mgnify:CR=1 FL=1
MTNQKDVNPCKAKQVRVIDLVKHCSIVLPCVILTGDDKEFLGLTTLSMTPAGNITVCVWRETKDNKVELVCRVGLSRLFSEMVSALDEGALRTDVRKLLLMFSSIPRKDVKHQFTV